MVLWRELLPVETLILRERALPAGSTKGGRKKMGTTNDADIACIVALEDSDAAANVVTCIVLHDC
jgi:hypothetical protein